MELGFSQQIFKEYSDFMKIRPMDAEFLHADGRTDMYDEANNRFSQFWEHAEKKIVNAFIKFM